MSTLTHSPAWQALALHADEIRRSGLARLPSGQTQHAERCISRAALALLPARLPPLETVSNRKRGDRSGQTVDSATGPVPLDSAGTLARHAFRQLLHQGTAAVPVDFVILRAGRYDQEHHAMLAANALAHSRLQARSGQPAG